MAAENAAGADASAGAGDNSSAGNEKTFTQAEVSALVARETKKAEAAAQRIAQEALAKTNSELEALKAQMEEHGKSAAEKAQLAAQRERAVLEQKLAELEKGKTVAEQTAAQRAQELRNTKLDHELNTLIAGKKALPQMMRFALGGFRADAKIEYDDESGAIKAVDVADKRYGSLKDAVDAWWKDHGAGFEAAPAGGAGTRASNGSALPANLWDQEPNELLALDAKRRARP